ncbi:GPR1 FUN34 yaaH protein [Micractinium conductrix]|uniref:GPR1 FUN34 yaaH protein n=2 Tax=Micractinium conductrix TaxID=554055 RepID=A0A2P6V7P8_9CHLO|nr:GPR1 FUN34 yaaH protein [Micractinium conductrix]|eukprot:PSC70112.1 GPR1 FUN34 yaaH protein [Micractinium conductrix]
MLRLALASSSRLATRRVASHAQRAVAAASASGRGLSAAPAPGPGRSFTSPSASAQLKRSTAAAASFGNVDVKGAAELVQSGASQYVDVRTPEEFQAGHAPGAANVPVMLKQGGAMTPNPEFVKQFEAAFPDKSAQLCVGCQSGKRSDIAAQMLSAAGYSALQNVEGGFAAWAGAGLPVTKEKGERHSMSDGPPSVQPAEAKQLVDSGHTLVDVRTPEEFAQGHVPGSINVPIKLDDGAGGHKDNPDFLAQAQQQLKPGTELVCTCAHGRRGGLAAVALAEAGFRMSSDGLALLAQRLQALSEDGVKINPATANPAPLGLYGFALTTALLQGAKTQLTEPTGTTQLAVSFGFFFGGLAQFCAGLLEYQRRNTFGTVAFCCYGAFWMSLAIFVTLSAAGVYEKTPIEGDRLMLTLWGILTFLLWLCTFHTNVVTCWLFFSLAVLFWLLAGGVGPAEERVTLTKVAGGWGFMVAAVAFYDGTAALMKDVYGRQILPVWPLKPVNKVSLGDFGTKRFVDTEAGAKAATANPAPLGLYGFALTTALLQGAKTQLTEPTGTTQLAVSFGFFFGGLAQFCAGLLEYQRRNTFGTVAFCCYGAFWMSLAIFTTLSAGGVYEKTPIEGDRLMLTLWGILTFLLWLCTFHTNVVTCWLFFSLAILFWLLAGGVGPSEERVTLTKVAGGWGFMVAAVAFYDGTASLMKDVYGRQILPVWPLKPVNKVSLGDFGTKRFVDPEAQKASQCRYESCGVEEVSVLTSDAGYTLIDVRTAEEFAAGHAPGALNVPFMVQTADGRTHNPEFLAQVRQAFPDKEAAQVCVTCGGGTRGTSAATLIAEDGYAVKCMPGGMKAWSARGLPTTQA